MSADKLILEVIFKEISYNLKNIGKIREKKEKENCKELYRT